jgi:hypothetical protein
LEYQEQMASNKDIDIELAGYLLTRDHPLSVDIQVVHIVAVSFFSISSTPNEELADLLSYLKTNMAT